MLPKSALTVEPVSTVAVPFVLMKTYINETELNNYPYAMMRNGILFLAVPEMDAEPWTRPATCEWLEFMTTHYHAATTVIFSHQAIEDTTPADGAADSYRGQQDQGWWASLFQRNPQIKMFLHGHNHMAGWYQGNQSSGFSRPVQNFGHEMVFASPFPGMSWLVDYNPVDSIVIFTISPRFITAKAWKQDGTRGKWCAGFDQTWAVPTTYDPKAEDWYSFPFLIQDGETQQTDMKVLSANTTLQLVGTGPVELFYDPRFETKGIHTNENILGFDDDLTSKVTANTPGMTVHGPHTITFPPKHEWDRYCHDGHGGPPYHLFAVGTTPAAAPGGSYAVTMKARSRSGNGRFKLTMSCSDWGTKSQYSTLAGSSREVISHTFGTNEETVTGTYAAPNNDNAWFIQGSLEFADATDVDVSYFSIKRTQTSDATEEFQVALNGKTYAAAGKLERFVDGRPDVLVYETPVLTEPVRVQGIPVADIRATTTGSAVTAPHGVARITCDVSPANILNVTVAVTNLPSSARTSSPDDRSDIIVAVTEDRLSTEVKRGENQGRTLTHAAVVREMRTVGEASGPSPSADIKIKIAPEWIRAHLKVVAFVQERGSRRVLATSAVAVPQRQ
jgi:hypothetical protein